MACPAKATDSSRVAGNRRLASAIRNVLMGWSDFQFSSGRDDLTFQASHFVPVNSPAVFHILCAAATGRWPVERR
jgi:hypothetical protein